MPVKTSDSGDKPSSQGAPQENQNDPAAPPAQQDSRDLDEQAEEIRQNLINTDEATWYLILEETRVSMADGNWEHFKNEMPEVAKFLEYLLHATMP